MVDLGIAHKMGYMGIRTVGTSIPDSLFYFGFNFRNKCGCSLATILWSEKAISLCLDGYRHNPLHARTINKDGLRVIEVCGSVISF